MQIHDPTWRRSSGRARLFRDGAPSAFAARTRSITRAAFRTGLFRATLRVAMFAVTVCTTAGPVFAAQEDDAFVPIFDGVGLDGWVVENTEDGNITVRDGAISVAGPGGWLRSAEQYGDVRLALEFRFATDAADSGVFVRAATTGGFGRGWPNQSYQVQLRDMHQPSRFLPLGEIYRHGMPQGETDHDAEVLDARYRGVGEWHALEVEVRGEALTVWLDGAVITRAQGIANPTGYIGFQAEAGTVEYRNIRIRTLE